jgi:hypothetical protein
MLCKKRPQPQLKLSLTGTLYHLSALVSNEMLALTNINVRVSNFLREPEG